MTLGVRDGEGGRLLLGAFQGGDGPSECIEHGFLLRGGDGSVASVWQVRATKGKINVVVSSGWLLSRPTPKGYMPLHERLAESLSCGTGIVGLVEHPTGKCYRCQTCGNRKGASRPATSRWMKGGMRGNLIAAHATSPTDSAGVERALLNAFCWLVSRNRSDEKSSC